MKQLLFILFVNCLFVWSIFFSATSIANTNDDDSKASENTSEIVNHNKADTKNKAITIPKYARVFSTESTFADAKDDLLAAIGEKGLVVSYTSHAKSMLDNTLAVSGVSASVYDDAEIILFCKAGLSHELVAGNPHNIVLCPYSIAIYVLTAEPELVYLSFRTVQASDEEIKALTKPIEELLVEIIEEVI